MSMVVWFLQVKTQLHNFKKYPFLMGRKYFHETGIFLNCSPRQVFDCLWNRLPLSNTLLHSWQSLSIASPPKMVTDELQALVAAVSSSLSLPEPVTATEFLPCDSQVMANEV